MDGWGITNVIRPDTSQRRGRINVSISRDMVDDATQAHYWILPAEYLGNKVCDFENHVVCYNVTKHEN